MDAFEWHKYNNRIPKNSHAIFSPSKYSWVNYDEDKMVETYNNFQAKKLGTELHETASMLIKHKILLPDIEKTLNMFVNDSIMANMRSEVLLYYSDLFYGWTDAIGIVDNVLHIYDLKTGKTKASMMQLEIYAAFFFLEYDLLPIDFDSIELRIYQNDEVNKLNPTSEDIVPIMDKVQNVNRIIQRVRENERRIVIS